MKPAEGAEEVATLGGGEWNPRVPEQQGEDRAECRPEHEEREDDRHARAIDRLHEDRDDEARLRTAGGRHEFPPGHYPDDGQIYADVDEGHRGGADEDGPWNNSARVAHLVTDVADVIVTQIVVNADP